VIRSVRRCATDNLKVSAKISSSEKVGAPPLLTASLGSRNVLLSALRPLRSCPGAGGARGVGAETGLAGLHPAARPRRRDRALSAMADRGERRPCHGRAAPAREARRNCRETSANEPTTDERHPVSCAYSSRAQGDQHSYPDRCGKAHAREIGAAPISTAPARSVIALSNSSRPAWRSEPRSLSLSRTA
jgi:hypothetical protein